MNRFFMPYHLYQVQWLLMPGLLRQVPTTCVTVGLCSITGRQKWNPGDTSLNFCPVGRSDPSAFDAVKIQQIVSGSFLCHRATRLLPQWKIVYGQRSRSRRSRACVWNTYEDSGWRYVVGRWLDSLYARPRRTRRSSRVDSRQSVLVHCERFQFLGWVPELRR